MNKAFIFDFDGILVNNEPLWEIEKPRIYTEAYGAEIASQLVDTIGSNLEAIHNRAVSLGATVQSNIIHKAFLKHANHVYSTAPLTPGLDKLKSMLQLLGYKRAIVSASPIEWITIVLKRLQWEHEFDYILSLFDREDIPHKPSPAGYLHAMKELHVSPKHTLILEDSNTGIKSAKASGATVIGFKQNLIEGYKQIGADFYADDIEEVIKILQKFEEEIKIS